MSQQTIPEMARSVGMPRADDDVLFEIKTLQPRCNHCGSDTYPIDPFWPNGTRICVKCLMRIAEDPGYDENDYETLERENSDLQEQIADLENQITGLERDNASEIEQHTQEVTDLREKLKSQEELNRTMHDTVDILQEQIDGWNDDTQALRNKVSVLERDVDRWRTQAMRNGKAHS